jgi:signal peptidase
MTKHKAKNPINISIIIYIAIVIVVIVIIIGAAIFWFGVPQFPSFSINNQFYIVSSDSMIPSLNINDLLVIRDSGSSNNDDDKGYSSYSFYNLKVGDIIVFKAQGEEEEDQDDRRTITITIVHRVAEIIQTDDKSNNNNKSSGSRIIRTKGDANPFSIPGIDYPVREQDYIGKVVYVIPGVGLITKVFRPPVIYIIISITLTILLFLYIKKGKREQEKRKKNNK